jgi:hypothetical protein
MGLFNKKKYGEFWICSDSPLATKLGKGSISLYFNSSRGKSFIGTSFREAKRNNTKWYVQEFSFTKNAEFNNFVNEISIICDGYSLEELGVKILEVEKEYKNSRDADWGSSNNW